MPEPGKSRHPPSTNGMQKSKIEKKGCRSREKAVNPQEQTACKKAKSRKKDAGTGKKLASLKHKRHAKKQIEKKGCRNREKASKSQVQTACKKAKSRKRDAEAGEKPTTPKYKRHVKINKILNNILRYK